MAKEAAGLLIYRRTADGKGAEVFLSHPGGPYWAKKDVWSIPKGELDDGEDHLSALKREFQEEIGVAAPAGEYIDLGSAKASGNKLNFIWAVEADLEISKFNCESMVELEWPRGSGKIVKFPENDKVGWFDITKAYTLVYMAQTVFIKRLAERLGIEITAEAVEPTNPTLF
jgi:predicted NUDIX family NTP pyrophosphohydrolase